MINLLNTLIVQSKAKDAMPLPPLDFLDVIFNIMADFQDGNERSSSFLKKKKQLPTLSVMAKAVMYTFAANCFHRGLRTRLAFASFLFVVIKSSKKCYEQLTSLPLAELVEKEQQQKQEQEHEQEQEQKQEQEQEHETKSEQKRETQPIAAKQRTSVTFKEQPVDSKLLRGFDALLHYLNASNPSKFNKIELTNVEDKNNAAYVHDIDPMLSWNGQPHELSSRVFSLIEAALGTHETNVLIHSEYPHPHLMRKFLLSCSALQPIQCMIHKSIIPGVETFLHGVLCTFSSSKALMLSPVLAHSNNTTRALRSTISDGGFALCPSEFGADAVLHHCLALGYSSDWIVKHLVSHVDTLLGPTSHVYDVSGGANLLLDENKRNIKKKIVHKRRRLKSTAKKLLSTARLMSGLGSTLTGGSRLGSRLMGAATSKRSSNSMGANSRSSGNGNTGTGRRSSLRCSIRNSFMHLDSKKGEDNIETLRQSSFRCCITHRMNRDRYPGPFIALSGAALAEHAVENSYAVLTRKRRGQMGVVSLAWRAYLHLIHSVDLEIRVMKFNNIGIHINNVAALRSMEELIGVHFRQIMSGSSGEIFISMFFTDQFVGAILASMISYYCHDVDAIDTYAQVYNSKLKLIWCTNDEKEEIKEDLLGNFSTVKDEDRVADNLHETVKIVFQELRKIV